MAGSASTSLVLGPNLHFCNANTRLCLSSRGGIASQYRGANTTKSQLPNGSCLIRILVDSAGSPFCPEGATTLEEHTNPLLRRLASGVSNSPNSRVDLAPITNTFRLSLPTVILASPPASQTPKFTADSSIFFVGCCWCGWAVHKVFTTSLA